MRALTLDDILPLDEYASRRREHFESISRYLDRYRRVRIGPRITLVFENRQTLWYRVQELLRIARLADPVRVQQELDIYNRLLPSRDRLQAALLIDIADESRLTEELANWQSLRGKALQLRLDARAYPANLLTCRAEDRAIGAAHWVQFVLDPDGRNLLADLHRRAWFTLAHPGYQHDSGLLSDDLRQSLVEDLELSDRD